MASKNPSNSQLLAENQIQAFPRQQYSQMAAAGESGQSFMQRGSRMQPWVERPSHTQSPREYSRRDAQGANTRSDRAGPTKLDTADITHVTKQNLRVGGGLNYLWRQNEKVAAAKRELGTIDHEDPYRNPYQTVDQAPARTSASKAFSNQYGASKTLLTQGRSGSLGLGKNGKLFKFPEIKQLQDRGAAVFELPRKTRQRNDDISSQNSRNSNSQLSKIPKFIAKIEKSISPEQLLRAERAYFSSASLAAEKAQPDQYGYFGRSQSSMNVHASTSALPRDPRQRLQTKSFADPAFDSYPRNQLSKNQISRSKLSIYQSFQDLNKTNKEYVAVNQSFTGSSILLAKSRSTWNQKSAVNVRNSCNQSASQISAISKKLLKKKNQRELMLKIRRETLADIDSFDIRQRQSTIQYPNDEEPFAYGSEQQLSSAKQGKRNRKSSQHSQNMIQTIDQDRDQGFRRGAAENQRYTTIDADRRSALYLDLIEPSSTGDQDPIERFSNLEITNLDNREQRFQFRNVSAASRNQQKVHSNQSSVHFRSIQDTVTYKIQRSKHQICENLKVLQVLEPQEKQKQRMLDNYLDLYAQLQVQKANLLSPVRPGHAEQAEPAARQRHEMATNSRKPLLHQKILEYMELKNFKAFLKKQMHQDFERLSMRKDEGLGGQDKVKVLAGQDSITAVLQFIRQYQQNFKQMNPELAQDARIGAHSSDGSPERQTGSWIAPQAQISQDYAQPEDADSRQHTNIERLPASLIATAGGLPAGTLEDAPLQRAPNENEPSSNQHAAMGTSADLDHLQKVFIPHGGYFDVKQPDGINKVKKLSLDKKYSAQEAASAEKVNSYSYTHTHDQLRASMNQQSSQLMSATPSPASGKSGRSIRSITSALALASPAGLTRLASKKLATPLKGKGTRGQREDQERKAIPIDPNTLETIKFETSIDIDNFLNMPMHKKLAVSDVPDLPARIAPALAPKILDRKLLDLENLKLTKEEFLARYQGFWTQKQSSGCVLPTASYQVLAGCMQRKLYIFAEQKIGSGAVKAEQKGHTQSSAFKVFHIDVVSKNVQLRWESRKVEMLAGGQGATGLGSGLCLAVALDGQLLFQFGGLQAMSADKESCKLCDARFICTDSNSLRQQTLEYTGDKVAGRKYPSICSPENIIEMEIANQKVFIFGGYNTMHKFINDGGYYMYTVGLNRMEKIPVKNQLDQELLMRSQHTVNSIKIIATAEEVLKYNTQHKVNMTNYKHIIFGGEVYCKKQKKRIASDALIIIEQEVLIDKQFVQIGGNQDDSNVPSCAPSSQNKTFKQVEVVVQRVKSIRKVQPANGRAPAARYCHQSVLVGAKDGSMPKFLLVYGGLDTGRNCLEDMSLLDLYTEIWTPITQAGFIPRNNTGCSGRYNFGMAYNDLNNQVVVFGGQSEKGAFCKPLVHQFQLPDWVLKHKPWRVKKVQVEEANFGFKSRSALAAAAIGGATLSVAGSGGEDGASTINGVAADVVSDCPLAQLRAKTAKFQELLASVQEKKVQAIERLADDSRLTVSYTEVSTAGRRSALVPQGLPQNF